MDTKRVENFFELIEGTDIKELCWERDGVKLRLKRSGGGNVLGTQVDSVNEQVEVLEDNEKEEGLCIVKSKFVGTFHKALKPGDTPLVKKGDSVKKEQKIGAVEAMKIFKDIVSEYDGTVEKIFVTEGQAIDYGQDLFLIRS